jgi:hypothetical protein
MPEKTEAQKQFEIVAKQRVDFVMSSMELNPDSYTDHIVAIVIAYQAYESMPVSNLNRAIIRNEFLAMLIEDVRNLVSINQP